MIRESHVRFLGEGREATLDPYPLTKSWADRALVSHLFFVLETPSIPEGLGGEESTSSIGCIYN